jgi:PAS domain S-box-containing protein
LLKVSPALARSALEAAPDAMLMIDEAGINRFANLQVSAIFGFSREAVIGLRVEDLMPERFRSRHVGHPIKPEPTDFTVAASSMKCAPNSPA